jgi:hypothetical protein
MLTSPPTPDGAPPLHTDTPPLLPAADAPDASDKLPLNPLPRVLDEIISVEAAVTITPPPF